MGASRELGSPARITGSWGESRRRGAALFRSLWENRLLRITLALAWILVVTAGYFVVHKPLSTDQALTLGRIVIDLIAVSALAILAGALGRILLRADRLAPLERLALQASLGWGILGLFWLLVGSLGFFRPWFAWSILLGGLVMTRRFGLAWLAELADFGRIWHTSRPFGKLLAFTIALMAAMQLVYSLAPPAQWDALVYHLQLPRQYLAAGRFYFVGDNPFWGQPPFGESLYSLAQILARNQTAALLGWTLQSVLVLGLLGSAGKRCGATSAWVACLALMTGYSFRWLMSGAYVDGWAALFGFCALIALLAWIEDGPDRWLAWCGVFAGLALWSKLTAGLLLPVLVLSVLISKRRPAAWSWRTALFPCLVALVIFSPWLIINFVQTGNPLYPQIWPTEWVSPQRLAYFEQAARGAGDQGLWLPLAATWFGVDAASISGMPTYGWDLGPLLLLLAVPGLIAGRRSAIGRTLALWLICGWAGMALAGRFSPLLWQTRLYLFLLPAACLCAAYGWQSLAHLRLPSVRFDRILAGLIGLVAVLSLWQDLQQLARHNPLRAVLDPQFESGYLESRLPAFPAAMQAIRQLPAGSSTLFLWEPRGLYAPLGASPDIWIDRWYLARRSIGEPERILGSWRAAGFTHLLINRRGAEFEFSNRGELTFADRQALDEVLAQMALLKDFGGVYQLYDLSP